MAFRKEGGGGGRASDGGGAAMHLLGLGRCSHFHTAPRSITVPSRRSSTRAVLLYSVNLLYRVNFFFLEDEFLSLVAIAIRTGLCLAHGLVVLCCFFLLGVPRISHIYCGVRFNRGSFLAGKSFVTERNREQLNPKACGC